MESRRERARRLRSSATDAERRLWSRLRARRTAGAKFLRQYPYGPFYLDFVCLEQKLVIEVDGGQHDERHDYDQRRTDYLNQGGFRVLRFWNNEVLADLATVEERIAQALRG